MCAGLRLANSLQCAKPEHSSARKPRKFKIAAQVRGPAPLPPSPELRSLMDLWARVIAHTVVCCLKVRVRVNVSEHTIVRECRALGGLQVSSHTIARAQVTRVRVEAPALLRASSAAKPHLHTTVEVKVNVIPTTSFTTSYSTIVNRRTNKNEILS